VSAWYNEVKVLNSSESSYFAVNGHAYGYAGIQEVTKEPFTGRVMFSIWDQLCTGDDENACPEAKRANVTQCGADVWCTRFGGEGTGAKAQWEWNGWKKGESYAFLTVAAERPNDRVEYTGYFYAPSFGWKSLASMIVNRGGKNWGLHGLYSFVEQFTHAEVEDLRWAQYGPALVRADTASLAQWTPLIHAKWSHGTNASESQVHLNGEVTNSSGYWAMGLGGNLRRKIDRGTHLTISSPQACPLPLITYVSLETTRTLPTGGPYVESVSCGGHRAATCGECPLENGANHGASWCNGECAWQNGKCQPKNRRLATLQCTVSTTPASSTTMPTTTPTTTNAEAATPPVGCSAHPVSSDWYNPAQVHVCGCGPTAFPKGQEFRLAGQTVKVIDSFATRCAGQCSAHWHTDCASVTHDVEIKTRYKFGDAIVLQRAATTPALRGRQR